MEIMLKCRSPRGCELGGEVGGLFTFFNPAREGKTNPVCKWSFISEIRSHSTTTGILPGLSIVVARPPSCGGYPILLPMATFAFSGYPA